MWTALAIALPALVIGGFIAATLARLNDNLHDIAKALRDLKPKD